MITALRAIHLRTRWACIVVLALGLQQAPAALAQAPGWQGAAAIGNSANGVSANGITAMATDAAGNVYVTGVIYDQALFNNTVITSDADGSGFVAKWSPITRRFVWAFQFGAGQGEVLPLALVVRGADVFVAGGFTVTGLNWGNTFVSNSSWGGRDGFVAKFTDLGSSVSYGWLRKAGGTGYDVIEGLAVSGNNVYATGTFSATAAFGSTSLVSLGTRDGFVAKLNDAGGGSFDWVQRLGGAGVDEAHKVAAAGSSVYVTAHTTGSLTLGSTTVTSAGGTDGLVAKLTDAGSTGSFEWVQSLRGVGNETVWDVAVDGAAVYVAGSFTGAAATFGGVTLGSAGGLDGVVARLTDAGSNSSVVWALRMGGPLDDEPQALAVLGGKAYVTGYFNSGSTGAGGPVAAFGSTQLSSVGGSDAFVTRVTDTGLAGRIDWAQAAGSSDDDFGNAVVLNGTTACVGGYFTGARFTVGATNFTNLHTGSATSFVASLTDLALPTRSMAPRADMVLYPNPARGTATVHVPASGAPKASLTLLDARGQVARTQSAVPGSDILLDLAGLPAGVYALRVQVGAAVYLKPLAVE
ncbi:T9SS type A sorting domain-containing protein [Hymenobacter busanensis]|uniref:T9SS type A sorting domain-containing protein n=1 Tax=Hymenobacter busanensis TaxID=2607656 RepID=A0A7L4ZXL5_9BACT|nr:T9SS type A sorting domain-containing protein [Hymenobacter busanensis]KAA9332106.1 T9SS type A sorting domain-containing protein [Hymenobacter busanensis]QHJ07555.1 T9SS type A sorting domain-containing protein [Hymenobacter busanensis]